MAGDWVKLHRKIIDSRVFSDEKLLKVWVWCLCRAGFREQYWRGKSVAVGSFITGRKSGADECGLHPSSFHRAMKRLEEWKMIERKSNNRWTTVSVCNWGSYQNQDDADRTTSEQPANSGRTAGEQPANTVEECKESKEGKECKEDSTADKSARRFTYSGGDAETARWMHSLNTTLQPDRKPPSIEAWANEIRLMRERDNRTDEAIRSLYEWCHNDSFWSVNIMSPQKLRDKWDNIKLRQTRQPKGGSRESRGNYDSRKPDQSRPATF